MTDKVLILGCGPAGLLAAHACKIRGVEVDIISKKQRSHISGAQFLHEHIPELTDKEPDGTIQIIKMGTAAGYAYKVYGDPQAPTSWNQYPMGPLPVWSMGDAYQRLWVLYHDLIIDGHWEPHFLDGAMGEYLAIFSTIPKKVVFGDEFSYRTERVVIHPYLAKCSPEQIVYNGDPHDNWYRTSSLFGHCSTEFPGTMVVEDADVILKPLSSTAPDNYQNLHCLGRYGKWKKGELVHHAFRDANRILTEMGL